jgi:hypothetical protein
LLDRDLEHPRFNGRIDAIAGIRLPPNDFLQRFFAARLTRLLNR